MTRRGAEKREMRGPRRERLRAQEESNFEAISHDKPSCAIWRVPLSVILRHEEKNLRGGA